MHISAIIAGHGLLHSFPSINQTLKLQDLAYPKMEITNPRRILAVSSAESVHHLTRVIKGTATITLLSPG